MKEERKKLAAEYYTEAIEYFRNAKEILKQSRIDFKRYIDKKIVRKACATCYIGLLLAIDGYLIERGVKKEELPKSYMGYWTALNNYLAHNGKVRAAFQVAYDNLHVLGYYRGGTGIQMIKEGFSCAKFIIEQLSKKRI